MTLTNIARLTSEFIEGQWQTGKQGMGKVTSW